MLISCRSGGDKKLLDLAYKYQDKIKIKLMNTWYDDKFKFYHCSVYHNMFTLKEDAGDWNCRQFASVNAQGDVIGLIKYGIDRETGNANYFGAINFSDDRFMFGMDLAKTIDDIFCKFNMRKLEFSVVIGNPIEKSYDKMIAKYGGRIIGVLKQHYKLIDDKYYDEKIYEIFRDDYIKAKDCHSIH